MLIKKFENDLLKLIRYYPFKKWVVTRILNYISLDLRKAEMFNLLFKHFKNKEIYLKQQVELTKLEIAKVYCYPKQVELGEKTPYEYSDYIKVKIKYEILLNELSYIKEITKNYEVKLP